MTTNKKLMLGCALAGPGLLLFIVWLCQMTIIDPTFILFIWLFSVLFVSFIAGSVIIIELFIRSMIDN